MPIAPEHRWFYPIDWRELSHVIRFTRAQGRCERCGRPHGRNVTHLGDGTWWDAERGDRGSPEVTHRFTKPQVRRGTERDHRLWTSHSPAPRCTT